MQEMVKFYRVSIIIKKRITRRDRLIVNGSARWKDSPSKKIAVTPINKYFIFQRFEHFAVASATLNADTKMAFGTLVITLLEARFIAQ